MKSRYKFIIGGLIIFGVLTGLSIVGLQEATVFFYTPQEILAAPNDFANKTIRVGALVQKGSVNWDAQNLRLSFNVTEDGKSVLPVVYQGVKPDMFKEGQGVVIEGQVANNVFNANQLLVKHSEDYKVDPKAHKNKGDYYKSLQTP
ncbi:cytochrome c maturation protein CcmE [Deltaproteobacteria bacterium TL4]